MIKTNGLAKSIKLIEQAREIEAGDLDEHTKRVLLMCLSVALHVSYERTNRENIHWSIIEMRQRALRRPAPEMAAVLSVGA